MNKIYMDENCRSQQLMHSWEIGFFKNYKQNLNIQPSTCDHQIFNDEKKSKIKFKKKKKNNLLTSLQSWKVSGLGTNQ